MTPSEAAYNETDTDIAFDPANWTDYAACAGTKTDLFFPVRGDNGAQAKKVCAGCPVREQCLQHAVDNHIDFGVWGGLSPRDRRPMAREAVVYRFVPQTDRPRLRPISHGTVSGYRAHRRRNEIPCAECRQAKADDMANYRRGDTAS